jgi:hypothetical protein
VTAVVTPLALVATVATIWITTCTSNRQLKLSATTFQGSMIYNAMKDARETAALYHEGKASEQDIFAIMQSIYLQHDLGNIVGNAWEITAVRLTDDRRL